MSIMKFLNDINKTISFEVFPPKDSSNFNSVKDATEEIAKLAPSFISITYGAGGGTSAYTLDMCKNIQDTFNIDTVAHLTCISSTKETIQKQLDSIKKSNINNILALRGDLTPELINNPNAKRDYNYAIDLIREIVEYDNLFCIGGACYPEGHPESSSLSDNLIHIKEKVYAGCSFLTTQMFFDNKLLFNFIDKALSININVPILPGIMPITSSKQLYRINTLSGATIPHELQSIITKYENSPLDMEKAGIDYAINQVLDLFNNGINHVHIYTMNKPLVAKKIKENLEGVL